MTSQEKAIQFFERLYGGDYSGNRKYQGLVNDFLDVVSDPMGVILNNPYDLVTDYHFPFRYFMQNGYRKLFLSSFEDYLDCFYAGMYDLLERTETSGNTWMDWSAFIARLLKRFPEASSEFVLSSIVYFNQTKDLDHQFYYDGNKIGLLKNRNMEFFIANKVSHLLRESSCSTSDFSFTPSGELCEEQNDAIRSVMQTDFSILTGGPGTGKTTTINFILKEYQDQYENKDIVLLAPTGKAAKRMDSCTFGAYHPTTIHYLAFREHYDHNDADPDLIDFCVIDEGSMIPLDIFYELLRYVRIRKLLIVGDVDQLQSVSCGDILHDLIDLHVPCVRLFQNHRSGDAIVENARLIRQGSPSLAWNEDFRMVSVSDDEVPETVLSLYDPDTTMVLCPTRSLAREMNLRIRAMLFPGHDPRYYVTGDKVLFVRNNRAEGYVNGDTGVVTSVQADGMTVDLDHDAKTIFVRGKIYDDVELGYALTIHKAQGSEYDKILLCVPKDTKYLFSRNLIYTAVTRAKESVAVIGSEDALKAIIGRSSGRRQTFLRSFALSGLSGIA